MEGSVAELGVYKGNSASVMKYYADKYNRKMFLYDTFEGFDARDLHHSDSEKSSVSFKDTSLDYVKNKLGDAVYRKGYFPDSIDEEDFKERFAFVSLDCDLHDPMLAGLEFFYPRLNRGGMIFCHDYSSGSWEGCTRAIDKFAKENDISMVLLPDVGGSAVIKKA